MVVASGAAVVLQGFENPRELPGGRSRRVDQLLAEDGDRICPDDYFADVYQRSVLGRPTIPALVSATVLVGQCNRMHSSARSKRFLDDTKVVASHAAALRVRVPMLDSTPFSDAVSTEDTVTHVRSAIRKLMRALAGSKFGVRVRAVLSRGDVAGPGEPASVVAAHFVGNCAIDSSAILEAVAAANAVCSSDPATGSDTRMLLQLGCGLI